LLVINLSRFNNQVDSELPHTKTEYFVCEIFQMF